VPNHIEKVKEAFLNGNNCAQSVLIAFEEEIGFERDVILKLATGFGAGMAKMQKTCGAITGAIMVLGLLNAHESKKSSTTSKEVRQLTKDFEDKFGESDCYSILKVDLMTDYGQMIHKSKLRSNICLDCVETAVKIIEKIKSL